MERRLTELHNEIKDMKYLNMGLLFIIMVCSFLIIDHIYPYSNLPKIISIMSIITISVVWFFDHYDISFDLIDIRPRLNYKDLELVCRPYTPFESDFDGPRKLINDDEDLDTLSGDEVVVEKEKED